MGIEVFPKNGTKEVGGLKFVLVQISRPSYATLVELQTVPFGLPAICNFVFSKRRSINQVSPSRFSEHTISTHLVKQRTSSTVRRIASLG